MVIRQIRQCFPPPKFPSIRYIKKWKGHTTASFDYYACCSCALLLMPLGVDTHQRSQMKRFQETRRVWACGPRVPSLKILMYIIVCCMKL